MDSQQILDVGQQFLNNNDLAGYWSHMAQFDTYAVAAREASLNIGLGGYVANRHLDAVVQESWGRPLTAQERFNIRKELATQDLAARSKSLKDEGNITLTSKQVTDYHTLGFDKFQLPPRAFTAYILNRFIGPLWSASPIMPAYTEDITPIGIFDGVVNAWAVSLEQLSNNPMQYVDDNLAYMDFFREFFSYGTDYYSNDLNQAELGLNQELANMGVVHLLNGPINGPINGAAFTAWVEQSLAPTLAPGDGIILDNLGSHKAKPARQALRKVGAHLLFLPPYSPDLNPIEMMFAKLKTMVRKADERTIEATWKRVGKLLDAFAPQECAAYLRHAGYGSV